MAIHQHGNNKMNLQGPSILARFHKKTITYFFFVSERNLRNNNVMFNLLITVTDVKNASLLKNFHFLTKILLTQWCSHWFEFCFLRWFKLNFWSHRSQEFHVTHSLLIFSALTCVKSWLFYYYYILRLVNFYEDCLYVFFLFKFSAAKEVFQ